MSYLERYEQFIGHDRLIELLETKDSLNKKIQDLNRERKTARRTLQQVSWEVVVLTNKLSPVALLPTEILIAIFVVAGNFGTLARVMRRWREIVNGTPEFWSTINYSLCYGDRGEEHELTLALERSRKLPLDIRFTFVGNERFRWFTPRQVRPDYHNRPKIFLATYLAALMSHAHRIRTEYHEPLYQTLTAFRDISAPLLERIDVDASPSSDNRRFFPIPLSFLRAGLPG